MINSDHVKRTLFECLKRHDKDQTLHFQTPRQMREQVSKLVGESVESLKNDIKAWINEYLDAREANAGENIVPENKGRIARKRSKVRRREGLPTSSESDAESASSGPGGLTVSPPEYSASGLRSLAKLIGVPPSFWMGIEKNNVDSVSAKLKEFCDAKMIMREGDIPTMKEAKRYQLKREAAAELEGINESNIVESRRRRCRDFIPLY